MRYSVVFLDLDNTILDFGMAEKKAITKLLENNNVSADNDTVKLYSEINDGYWKSFERGEIKKEEIFSGRFKSFTAALNLNLDPEKLSKEYFGLLSFGNDVIDGAKDFLSFLKSKNVTVCITTNGVAATQYKRIEGSGLKQYFDYVFVSEAAGSQKPEKAYFDYVFKNIPPVDKSEILVIGDSESSDIAGGINSGLDTCLFDPESRVVKTKAKYTVHSLSEINKYIEGI
mgnify:CR=1 FL=1